MKRFICWLKGHNKIYQSERIDLLAITIEYETCERCRSYKYVSRIIH